MMDSFARLRSKFLASTSFNSKNRPDAETQHLPGIHLPYLVCLLQTAGYHLGKVDCINPKYMNEGTSIVLSCGYSGQRCILHCPEEQAMCNCFIKGEDSSNFFLEAVSQGQLEERWLVENNSDQYCLPFISDDLKLLCKTVILELVAMMKDSYKSMRMGTPQNDDGTTDPTVAIPKNSQVAVPYNSQIAIPKNSRVAVPYNSQIAIPKNSQVAVPYNSQIAIPQNCLVSVPQNSRVAVPENSQGSSCLVLDTMNTNEISNDSTFTFPADMSSDLQAQTVTVAPDESNFQQSTELKAESWKMYTVCSAISVTTESVSQKSTAVLKSPKPAPLPIKNVQKVNSFGTKHSLIPKTTLSNKVKSTSSLKVLGGNISTSKDHRSPLSMSNSKSTPNLLSGTTGSYRSAGSHLKAIPSPGIKRASTPQLKIPSRTTTSLAGPSKPSTPRITTLKSTPLKIPVKGANVASNGKSKSTPVISRPVSATPTTSGYKKTAITLKEKTEKKVIQVTAKAAGCFGFKK